MLRTLMHSGLHTLKRDAIFPAMCLQGLVLYRALPKGSLQPSLPLLGSEHVYTQGTLPQQPDPIFLRAGGGLGT